MTQWYEQLFENYANKYEQEPFTKGTMGEVDFIEREIRHDKSTRILDIGCGTGRHSIELARRGYPVVGVDLSECQLKRARENAERVKAPVQFIRADARRLEFRREFDLVLMLCEGAFPLMETDEMNFEILKNARNALKERGKIIFTTLNGLYPLFHSVSDFINSHHAGELNKEISFDLMTFRDHSEYELTDDDGISRRLKCDERYYVPSEITWLLKSLGFTTVDILGCELGAWRREKALTTEDFEMLVVAES
jgi:2-polyprenyl-3-methyl-5-hydroxy-6-metoxy-1,4-benzoquinol methylase